MTNKTKPQPNITFTLKPAQPTPAQIEASRRLWSRIIGEAKAAYLKDGVK